MRVFSQSPFWLRRGRPFLLGGKAAFGTEYGLSEYSYERPMILGWAHIVGNL